MSTDKETLGVYDARAEHYAEVTSGIREDPDLAAFIAAMPKGGRVLDLGCGPGLAAEVMAQAGLTVDATDASAEMVRLAAARPGVSAWQAHFDEIAGEAIYDGVWANFSLLHADRAAMPRHLAALARALRPSGRLHVGLKTGTGTRRDSLGRLYTYYTEDELEALLQAAGFTVIARRSGRDPGLDGEMADWVTMAALAGSGPRD
ncbi:class I SAM-dependent DNA methyltransferase [Rhodosalinus halophilus]|uniref:class I SAM-dependent DNA methyltransferase n=1 Tax=Rhodosalinus halophilus TaxID=2259333 RepID=UPI001F1774DE|nr:class I SAM-dependent methyltransferase [Rhodosalinus halophilus]